MTGRYALHHDGTWFYFLGTSPWRDAVPLADGEPMAPCETPGWWSTAREGAEITIARPGAGTITGYRLHDPATASERYPLELAAGEYERRRSDDEDDLLPQLYGAVREPGEPVTEPVVGPWLRLDGEPPPRDGRAWVASLPFELRRRAEYLHLFPGYMPGFRDAMEQVVKGLPGVRFALPARHFPNHPPHGLEVTIEVPFDQPQGEYRPARNQDGSVSRSRKGRTVPVLATRRLALTVPYRIDAANRAEAAAEWDRMEAEIRQAVAEASVAACSACMGRGWVISGSERHEKRSS
jgi:hypothetical protein